MTIVPDTKDWTWVLRRPCPECGLDTREVAPDTVPARIRVLADQWQRTLTDHPSLRTRPAPGMWSPLEYGCHVRDVLRIFRYRLDLVLTEDHPVFPDWDQDAAAVEDRYGEQDPHQVAAELRDAAAAFADSVEGVPADGWDRPGSRGDGAAFTAGSLTRYVLHEITHHLHDVRTDRPPQR
jgi:hypothetical protein